MLTDEQKKKRVDISIANLEKFQADKENFLSRFLTMDETWIHHFDPETKQQSMTWKRADEPMPKKFKVSSSAGKVMASVFWDAEGIIMVDYLEKGATITGSYYAEQIRRLREAIKEKRRGKLRAGVLFHQDNALAHKAAVAMATIQEAGFELVEHPPYSPDLASSDFFLFPRLKEHLRGKKFDDNSDFFDLKSHFSCGSCDIVLDIDNILEKVDCHVSKELEISLVEPGEEDRKIITNAYNRVVKLISEETRLISALKEKYVSSLAFKKNMSEWINKNPNVDDLITVKKSIKGLKAQLRWKLLESSSMEESDDYNATAHSEVKHEIETIRNKIFYEIQQEQNEYALLSDLVQNWFPELPLMYFDVGITSYMNSGGLLSGSMERELFDAEPLKEYSSKRPL
ncbi:unnamed protein product, partial [Ranitomeya imitator]